MGGSGWGARIPALSSDVLGGFRSSPAARTETVPFGSVRCLAANARRDSRGHFYELLEPRFAVVCPVEGDEGSGRISAANATHALHQPRRSDVALDNESRGSTLGRRYPSPSIRDPTNSCGRASRQRRQLRRVLVLVYRMPCARWRVAKSATVVREALGICQPSGTLLGANWSKRPTSGKLPTGIHAFGADQHRNVSGQGPFWQGRIRMALASFDWSAGWTAKTPR